MDVSSQKLTERRPPKRKPNYSEDELLKLVKGVSERKALVFSPSAAAVKNKAWDDVTAEVNSVSRGRRKRSEVRKKFKDFRSEVKIKARRIWKESRTGGGSEDRQAIFRDSEATMLSLFHPDILEKFNSIAFTEEAFSNGSAVLPSGLVSAEQDPLAISSSDAAPTVSYTLAPQQPINCGTSASLIILPPALSSAPPPQTYVDHSYHASPATHPSSPAESKPPSINTSIQDSGNTTEVPAIRMIQLQTEMKDMLDRYLGRIAESLEAIAKGMQK